MNDIILLTAAYRFDNICYIAKQLNILYNKYIGYSNMFNMYWVICKDQYNGKGNIEQMMHSLSQCKLKWKVIDSGKPNQKNYGGDMYNEPLKYCVEKYWKLENPWVYILDDDNIIDDNFIRIMYTYNTFDSSYTNKYKVILTNQYYESGQLKMLFKETMCKSDSTYFYELADPSQVLLKYDIIKKYGYYTNEYEYDVNWLTNTVIKNELKNDTVFFIHNTHLQRYTIHTYHNAIKEIEDINKYIYDDINCISISVNVQSSQLGMNSKIDGFPILSTNAKRKILDIIKDDIITTHKL